MKAVGCSCTLSISTRFAPTLLPALTPLPSVNAPFVVGTPTRSGLNSFIRLFSEWSKPKPPVVITTASHLSSTSSPSCLYLMPKTSRSFSFLMNPVISQPVFISISGMPATAARACCIIVYPTGTGVPSLRGGTRCVRFLAWPPSCESTVRLMPNSSMSQLIASELCSESIVTHPRSDLPPFALTWVSRSKYRPSSSMPWLNCTRVPQALIPLVAFAELPPRSFSFSINVTLARALKASMAALTPARPPPTMTTCAGSCCLRRSSSYFLSS
mmetsp:Transcript_128647/g.223002  ORF Transcript_128647/g.223002 Transcript_128647/m.223002 type:complete len:271 (-) Transcript_128647:1447-2259(-)